MPFNSKTRTLRASNLDQWEIRINPSKTFLWVCWARFSLASSWKKLLRFILFEIFRLWKELRCDVENEP
jgi:hypothetical protein